MNKRASILAIGTLFIGTGIVINIDETASSQPETVIVTKTTDTDDGVCDSDCSLREAVALAPDNSRIVFESDSTQLSRGQLEITRRLTIAGTNRATVTISADPSAPAARIFFVGPGGSLTLTNAIVTGGSAPMDFGGGIYSEGTVTLINTEVTGNFAGGGGGIENRGTLNATNSTISQNIASQPNSAGRGGGIENSGTLVLINSTIAGNEATSGNQPFIYGGFGGGIYAAGGGSRMTLRNVTLAGNTATLGSGGGLYVNCGPLCRTDMGNTIVANNVAGASGNGHDMYGFINSEGYNLFEDTSAVNISGNHSGNIVGVDPQLDTNGLRNNGGATRTILLQANSPAIDKGRAAIAGASTDQRELPRPYDYPGIPNSQGGDGADMGSVEMQPAPAMTPTPTPTATPISSPVPTPTPTPTMFASVSGRVLIPGGGGLRNAVVSLTDSQAVTRSVTTSSFGFYTFSNVPTGASYTLRVVSRRFRFQAQTIQVNGDVTGVDFAGSE